MKPANKPHILCINPWIHDFAAYDVWAKPYGLLQLAAILRRKGYTVSYLDCLDRFHPRCQARPDPEARNGRGPYLKTRIPKPDGLEDVPRFYSRYGIPDEWFRSDLAGLPKPDLVLLTSLMTYWYPGVQHTIALVREMFPDVPVVLGGIYATLCREHAERHSGADFVVTGLCEHRIVSLVSEMLGDASVSPTAQCLSDLPYPAFDLQSAIPYVPLLTSRGCPFDCAYCASSYLTGRGFFRRRPESVFQEILFWHRTYHVREFVFYDDALLIDADNHLLPILEMVVRANLDVRFHTPNALHLRELTQPVVAWLRRANFVTIRLGLETTDFENRGQLDRKISESGFQAAARRLISAGFENAQIGAYLLVGLPGQSLEQIESSIAVVRQYRIQPVLAYFTPIPHTRIWKQAVASARYDIEADPVFTNNAILPCMEAFAWDLVTRLKNLAQGR